MVAPSFDGQWLPVLSSWGTFRCSLRFRESRPFCHNGGGLIRQNPLPRHPADQS